ncbi:MULTISPECIES: efflux RND transporter periplasmic adaptor subunit [Pseudoalteromonas]|uniref:efflux RND transporter periplasmic adaptor subunit n=1 Tax=Pseudoalteromonas TaxID=53246 RepID=UPI00110949F1|nr:MULTISPECIES: efflux RND transporter periplasmic adaptor subunit [Pseudoalteromonas]MCG9760643.1 efflux RND transporter periplasmic adaptor subunit [Pseudoalteromonas sp. Isolate6]NKC20836.1 efflux RND transporter periplasmic adaptor subunit [Pseudoalteromonas galatheae]
MLKPTQLATIISALLLLSACGEAEQASIQTPPIQPIDVAATPQISIADWHTYTTRLSSPNEVALRARVTGVISSVNFKEGDTVRQGDVLFELDDRTFLAEVASLAAQVKRAEAALSQAKSESARALRLSKQKAISTEEVDARVSLTAQREAELDALRASFKAAQLNLEFSKITAPISGKISFAEVTQGNTIRANDTLLTTIVATDKMYAYFDIDERTWNSQFASVTEGESLPVKLQLLGRESQPVMGELDFIDNAIDDHSGTLKVRASFDNRSGQLRPGSFARVSLSSGEQNDRVLIPDRAVGTDLKNRFVLVVNESNTLEYRLITLGNRYGKFRAVESGLAAGERIAVNGPARVGPGMPISPNSVTLTLPDNIATEVVAMTPSDSSQGLN